MKLLSKYGLGFWMGAVIIAAFYWVGAAKGFAGGGGNSARIMIFHVPAALVTVIGFIKGAWFAARYLKFRKAEDERKTIVALELAFIFGVLATVTGSIFALQAWGTAWNWDPRETSMIAQLMVYAAYFALRSGIIDEEQRARSSSAYALFALVSVPFLTFIVPRIPVLASLHPQNVIWKSDGLDIPYKVTLYASLIGYIWIYERLFNAQTAVLKCESLLEKNYELAIGGNASFAPSMVRRVPVSNEDGK